MTAIAAEMRTDQAAVVIAARLLEAIAANLPASVEGEDAEALHDLRVAVRRTRSLQRELKRVFPPGELKRFRAEFRWVQQVTGPTRDLDVYLEDLRGRPELAPLCRLLEERRTAERDAMVMQLRSARTLDLFKDWGQLLTYLPALPPDDRPDATRPVTQVGAARIRRVYRHMTKMGKAITDDSPHEDLHDLRKKGKELRYLLEFFSPLFPREVTKPMVKTLKSLQDTLGRFQDREVQADMVSGLRDQFAGVEWTVTAMDLLVERLHAEQAEARAEFADRFAAFASKDQRRLVKRTFREEL